MKSFIQNILIFLAKIIEAIKPKKATSVVASESTTIVLPETTSKKLYVNVDVLNVRLSPEVSPTNKIGSLKSGQEVVVLESNGQWTKISVQSGIEGWVSSKFLSETVQAPIVINLTKLDVNSNDFKGITATQLSMVVPNLKIKVEEYTEALNKTMQEFEINTPARQTAFIAQTAHESNGYSALMEGLNYSAEALVRTWPRHFTQENASAYARQPEKIANRAYANRMGNGDEACGDGWRYRGRGIIQVTGKDNYKSCGVALKLDLLTSPELLEQSIHAFRSGGWYWKSRNLNDWADKGDFKELTRRINGGYNGLEDRERYHALAKTALGVS